MTKQFTQLREAIHAEPDAAQDAPEPEPEPHEGLPPAPAAAPGSGSGSDDGFDMIDDLVYSK